MLLTAFATVAMAPIAMAGVEGRKNTALALTAGAVYAALRHKTGAALVIGGGAAYAWKRAADAKKNTYYYRSYRRGSNDSYYGGSRRNSDSSCYRGDRRESDSSYYGNREDDNSGYGRGKSARRVHFVKKGKVHYYSARR